MTTHDVCARQAPTRGRRLPLSPPTVRRLTASQPGGQAFTYGLLFAAGARTRPTRPATAKIVTT